MKNNSECNMFMLSSSNEKVNYYKENYLQIENIAKPLKAVTSYSKDELLIMAKKLDIKSIDGKKTKKDLYQMICSVI